MIGEDTTVTIEAAIPLTVAAEDHEAVARRPGEDTTIMLGSVVTMTITVVVTMTIITAEVSVLMCRHVFTTLLILASNVVELISHV